MGFAIKKQLVKQIVEFPVHISDRVTTLPLHLDNHNLLNAISVYAPTLDKTDDIKDQFYGELLRCLNRQCNINY